MPALRLSHESLRASRGRDILKAFDADTQDVGAPNREIRFVRQPPLALLCERQSGSYGCLVVIRFVRAR